MVFMVSEVLSDDTRREIGIFETRDEAIRCAWGCACEEAGYDGPSFSMYEVEGYEVEPFDGGENVYYVCDTYDLVGRAIRVWHGEICKL